MRLLVEIPSKRPTTEGNPQCCAPWCNHLLVMLMLRVFICQTWPVCQLLSSPLLQMLRLSLAGRLRRELYLLRLFQRLLAFNRARLLQSRLFIPCAHVDRPERPQELIRRECATRFCHKPLPMMHFEPKPTRWCWIHSI